MTRRHHILLCGLLTVTLIGAGLAAISIVAHFTTAGSWFLTGPAGVLFLVGIARVLDLSWHDLGFARPTLRHTAR